MEHLIQRQILELTFSSQQAAQDWTTRGSAQHQQALLAVLDEVFNELGQGQNIRIEKLEIDLGVLPQAGLATELASRTREQVSAVLQPYLQQQSVPAADGKEQPAVVDTRGSELGGKADESSLDSDSLLELFTTFLRSGQFPWWLTRERAGQLDRLYQQLWLKAPQAAEPLLRETISSPAGVMRLVEQFSGRSHRLTLRKLVPKVSAELLVDLRSLATHLLARQGDGLQGRRIGYKLVYSLVAVSDREQLDAPVEIGRRLFFTLMQICGIARQQLHEEIDAAVSRLRLQPATLELLAELLHDKEHFSQSQSKRDKTVTATATLDQESAAQRKVKAEPEIPVSNAGLVLLWPYLKELLQKLELLEMLDDGSQRPRIEAVLLLQQLVTGQPAAQENLLALNKLLCGIPLAAPVMRRQRRTKRWDTEVSALLSAAIKHWAVLKTTSDAGLRSGFLQREGFLREQGEGWLLQVERKPHDILLEQLPWGLGMVQFSWMPRPLQIEW